jgi:DNA polymerase-3 subunit alpha
MRYIGDCRDLGIPVLSPDINEGVHGFTVSGESIRFGLGAIKGVGQGAIAAVLREREDQGRFASCFDFCARVDTRQVNKKVLESLIKGGALDSLGMLRAQLLGNLPRLLEWAQRQQEDRQQGQFSLFGNTTAAPAVATVTLDSVPEWSESERLAHEKEALGFYISSHPLMAVRQPLRRLTNATSQSLADCTSDQTVTMGGMITQRRMQLTKNGDRMAFLTLEDLYGSFEVIVFPETYRRSMPWCESDEPLLVWGKVEGESSDSRIIAQRLLPLTEAEALGEFRRLTLTVVPDLERAVLLQTRDLLAASPGDCAVMLALEFADGERVLLRAADRLKVAPSMELLSGLEELLGIDNVRVA